MRKRIVDILASIQGGGVVNKGNEYQLCTYVPIERTKKEKFLHPQQRLKVVKKNVTDNHTEIEEGWKESRLPLGLTAMMSRMPGMAFLCRESELKREGFLEDIKHRIYVGILHRLLLDDLIPKGQINIWTEDVEDDSEFVLKVCGMCEV